MGSRLRFRHRQQRRVGLRRQWSCRSVGLDTTQTGMPITTDQVRQLPLLIEVERQAAENLFGETWDFSQGPLQGEQ